MTCGRAGCPKRVLAQCEHLWTEAGNPNLRKEIINEKEELPKVIDLPKRLADQGEFYHMGVIVEWPLSKVSPGCP